MFSRKVFWGATRPRRPPAILQQREEPPLPATHTSESHELPPLSLFFSLPPSFSLSFSRCFTASLHQPPVVLPSPLLIGRRLQHALRMRARGTEERERESRWWWWWGGARITLRTHTPHTHTHWGGGGERETCREKMLEGRRETGRLIDNQRRPIDVVMTSF